ncbi:M16 family metallopeptidase [Actinopolyspora xinjiangensis]|uniref:M16 family metallopeptidase n=1 Tax=Actinopolyspora xinjiangensis TaxID=405564 RepID=UPI001480B3F3|nr:pitrilysin family protein [Actinopolyspora xinjiangensis]
MSYSDRATPSVEILSNGLTLVTAPAVTTGVATVAVHVGVGFRSEPADYSGMAHFFEHLMFGGSANVAPGGHFAAVESVGGRVGGHTRHDYTELFDVVPAHALGEVVGLEADRLSEPRLDPETLRTQLGVIRAELEQVGATPYGGFPWRFLPPTMYSTHPNIHDGYGDLDTLATVTPGHAARFFATWYAPHRIVVTLEGDLRPSALAAARESLSAIPASPDSDEGEIDVSEPPRQRDRHEVVRARNIPEPVWAVGFRLPDPRRNPLVFAACTALATLLPVHDPAAGITARSGWFGTPADARSPDPLVLSTHPRHGVGGDQLIEMVRELLAPWRDGRPRPAVLETAPARLRLWQYQRAERPAHRARRLGATQLLFGDPLFDHTVDPARALDRDLLGAAAEHLLGQAVGSILVLPSEADAT